MRRAARRDANEPEVVQALQAIGCTVLRLNEIDLLVGYRSRNVLLEIKDGRKPPSARPLTESQRIMRAEWRGQYDVVTNPDEAIAVVQRVTLGRG